jgi:hypothetical protein
MNTVMLNENKMNETVITTTKPKTNKYIQATLRLLKRSSNTNIPFIH